MCREIKNYTLPLLIENSSWSHQTISSLEILPEQMNTLNCAVLVINQIFNGRLLNEISRISTYINRCLRIKNLEYVSEYLQLAQIYFLDAKGWIHKIKLQQRYDM